NDPDVGDIGLTINQDGTGIEIGVEVAAVGGHGEQLQLPLLVRGMQQLVTDVQGEIRDYFLERWILGRGSGQRNVDRAYMNHGTGLDHISGNESVPVRLQGFLDVRIVVTERLQRRFDIRLRALVQL